MPLLPGLYSAFNTVNRFSVVPTSDDVGTYTKWKPTSVSRCHAGVSRWDVTLGCHAQMSRLGVTLGCHARMSRSGVTLRWMTRTQVVSSAKNVGIAVSQHAESIFETPNL